MHIQAEERAVNISETAAFLYRKIRRSDCVSFSCIKWTNRYSGETGYVASISRKERHFINTYDRNEAKDYSSKTVYKMIDDLVSFGEAEDNIFEAIE